MEENKLYSVKGFIYETIKRKIKNNKGNDTREHRVRKLIILGKNLLWFDAKKLRDEHKDKRASIFPNVVEKEEKEIRNAEIIEKMEVITL